MDINYDYYKVFYYVAKYQSITRASKVLLSNQPNVTRTIKNLENGLGCPLFIRNKHGVNLTPEGKKLFSHIQIAFESIKKGEEEIKESRNLENGSIYIASSEVALRCFLLPILKKYHNLYPNIHLKISNHSTPQAIEAIKNGTADIALVTTPTVKTNSIIEKTIYSFNEITVCSPSFLLDKKRKMSFEKLLKYPLVSLGTNTKTYELYSSFFLNLGLKYEPSTFVSTADQILPMVMANLGIGFVPKQFLENHFDVFLIPLEKELPRREIKLIKRKEQPLSVASAKLEQLILENAPLM
ncbi:MAG TPA: LysR family transcriptional regulator [Firmicutes bacterium]|nr:LysR family transcriptional regulator [Bacillota bacterium]HBM70620.1 LysR family transcriptional regulator [Bacillota bacterium]HBX25103.1 LysR family transcriptional regulator [Bacillota bacterium]